VTVSDHKLLKARAELGVESPYYLGSQIVGLAHDSESPRTGPEVEPYYDWLDRPRPESMPKKQKWLRFWSTPRYTIKTYGLCIQLLEEIIREPNVAIIYQCQEKQNAIDAVDLVRQWLMDPEVVRLYGKFESDDWSKQEFTVAQRDRVRKDPTMRALGLDVPMQGKRCDIMVWDDLVGETNYNSDEGLLKVELRIAASLPVLRPGGKAYYICTRWSPYDQSTEGYTISNSPGIIRQWKNHSDSKTFPTWECVPPRGWFGAYAQEGDQLTYPDAVVGEPLYPSILDEDQIAREREAYTSHAMFSSQILNDPIPDESRYFEESQIIHFDYLNDEGNRTELLHGAVPFISVDLNSGKTNLKKGDDTTICVFYIKWLDNIFHAFIVEWVGGRWKPSDTRARVLAFNAQYRPRTIYPETNMGKEYFLEPLRKEALDMGIILPISEVTASLHGTGKKEDRISALQPFYFQGRMYHEQKLKNSRGEEQLLKWQPNTKSHDDFPDVLAHGILEATKRRHVTKDKTKRLVTIGGRGIRYRQTRV